MMQALQLRDAQGSPRPVESPPWLQPGGGSPSSRERLSAWIEGSASCTTPWDELESWEEAITHVTAVRSPRSRPGVAASPSAPLPPPPWLIERLRLSASPPPSSECMGRHMNQSLASCCRVSHVSTPVRISVDDDGGDGDDGDEDEQSTAVSPESAAVTCGVCGALYRGPVCRCTQLAMAHPVAKIMARVRHGQGKAAAEPAFACPSRSPKTLRRGPETRSPWRTRAVRRTRVHRDNWGVHGRAETDSSDDELEV